MSARPDVAVLSRWKGHSDASIARAAMMGLQLCLRPVEASAICERIEALEAVLRHGLEFAENNTQAIGAEFLRQECEQALGCLCRVGGNPVVHPDYCPLHGDTAGPDAPEATHEQR